MPLVTGLGRLIFNATQELAVGGLFCLTLLPSGLIHRRFFRTCVLVLASVVGLEVWVSPTPESTVLLASLLLYAGSLWVPDERWSAPVLRVSLAIGAGVVLIRTIMPAAGGFPSWETVAHVINLLASTLLLGSVLIGMLLGHYYLRDPKLPVGLIRRLANLFLLATVLQGLLLVVNMGTVYLFGGAEGAARFGLLSTSYGPVVLGRLFFGILGSFVLACLIWDTLRIPNVQAATGFFYIAILTVMIGEFLGRYLWHSTAIRF